MAVNINETKQNERMRIIEILAALHLQTTETKLTEVRTVVTNRKIIL